MTERGAVQRLRRALHRLGLSRVVRAAQRLIDPPGMILLYHRVASPTVDPWGISVRPEHFAQHLEVLRRMTDPVSLGQVLNPGRAGHRARPVAVTFDDGYADNLYQALPLLEQFQIPATVFVASGYVGQTRAFWWDELGHLLLHDRPLPGPLHLGFGGTWHAWPPSDDRATDAGWRADSGPPPSFRERLYIELYGLLRSLSPEQREAVLAALRDWAGPRADNADPHDRPLTRPELARLAAHPLIEIGAHTVTHPPLGDLDPAGQRGEIGPSRAGLEQLTGEPVTSFSFPFGSYSPESAGLVSEAGFARACVSAGQPVRRHTHPFAMPRLSVEDWSGEAFAARLRHWL